MDAIAKLADGALAARLGSAIAISVGERTREVFRYCVGHTRRVPTLGEPIDDRTPFDIASVTKVVATAALAREVIANGKLDPSAPLRTYLPECASTGSVRDALDHRAGFAAHVELYRGIRGAAPTDPYRELVSRAGREPCVAPGGPRVYSDLGFIVLGEIIARVLGESLDDAFARRARCPARYATTAPIPRAVATELDDRGLVAGLPHDENAYYARAACGHAGLFASIGDMALFAGAVLATANDEQWLGWDTPAREPGVSHVGDRWPREGAYGHNGFTGTSLWLDVPRGRWVVVLANRVHPTRRDGSAEAMKTLRRAIHDAVVEILG